MSEECRSQPLGNHGLSSAGWPCKITPRELARPSSFSLRHGFLERDDVVPQGLLDVWVPREQVVDVRIAFDEVVLQIEEMHRSGRRF